MAGRHFRALWLSDIHLGTSASRASDLLRFLDQVTAETIYLVGDIVDLERLKLRPTFPDEHRAVVGRLISLAQNGTRIVYVPGNHDFEFRHVAGSELCGIEIRLEAEHVTRRNKRLLVFHGDVLDAAIRRDTNLEKFASKIYFLLVRADVRYQQLRARFGGKFAPVSVQIKTRLQGAIEYISRFEQTASRYAASRGFDGLVCGHIHRPGIHSIDGVIYANDGDWVEHRTALAEDTSGDLSLLRFESEGIVVESKALPDTLAA